MKELLLKKIDQCKNETFKEALTTLSAYGFSYQVKTALPNVIHYRYDAYGIVGTIVF